MAPSPLWDLHNDMKAPIVSVPEYPAWQSIQKPPRRRSQLARSCGRRPRSSFRRFQVACRASWLFPLCVLYGACPGYPGRPFYFKIFLDSATAFRKLVVEPILLIKTQSQSEPRVLIKTLKVSESSSLIETNPPSDFPHSPPPATEGLARTLTSFFPVHQRSW